MAEREVVKTARARRVRRNREAILGNHGSGYRAVRQADPRAGVRIMRDPTRGVDRGHLRERRARIQHHAGLHFNRRRGARDGIRKCVGSDLIGVAACVFDSEGIRGGRVHGLDCIASLAQMNSVRAYISDFQHPSFA